MNLPPIFAWEITKACNLNCIHCRASATAKPDPLELSTKEGFTLLHELKHNGTSLVILSGGEALCREDVFDLASYGTLLGLRMTLATNGALVTGQVARKIRESGIVRVSVSLDAVNPDVHDDFRGLPGSFVMAVGAIKTLIAEGVPVQVNTTVAAVNISQMKRFPDFLRVLGVVAWHVFFLVPTGRGENVEPARIREYKDMLNTFYATSKDAQIECKATCAPQYYRMLTERDGKGPTRGCLAGTGFGFISAKGIVQPCGFLQIPCGDIRKESLMDIWKNSETLQLLRDMDELKGKCLACKYKEVCGGCRARAFEVLDDMVEEDPICWYAR